MKGNVGKIRQQLWYDLVPKSVETSHEVNVTVLWNQQVWTEGTITNNKPDITILDNKKGTYVLIYVAVPGDRNVKNKEAEKISKYKDLIT